MQESYLDKPKIYYRKSIKSKNPPLFFIHEVWGCGTVWNTIIKIINKHNNIILMDLRGNGKSFRPKLAQEYSIGEYAEDINRIMKKEELDEIIPIGNS